MSKPRSTDILSDSSVATLEAHLRVTKPWFNSVKDARMKLHFHQSALRAEAKERTAFAARQEASSNTQTSQVVQ